MGWDLYFSKFCNVAVVVFPPSRHKSLYTSPFFWRYSTVLRVATSQTLPKPYGTTFLPPRPAALLPDKSLCYFPPHPTVRRFPSPPSRLLPPWELLAFLFKILQELVRAVTMSLHYTSPVIFLLVTLSPPGSLPPPPLLFSLFPPSLPVSNNLYVVVHRRFPIFLQNQSPP